MVVVAYPLRHREWRFFRLALARENVPIIVVCLDATEAAILSPGRGRAFDPDEARRIATMIAQGYGRRPFADRVVRTDTGGFTETVAALESAVRAVAASGAVGRSAP